MRFLVDAQLPPALARWIVSDDHDAEHVFDIGLISADDRVIWSYAHRSGAVIVTKDEDFALRRSRAMSSPPIVWIRRGNVTRRDLLAWFAPLFLEIVDALERGETIIEVV